MNYLLDFRALGRSGAVVPGVLSDEQGANPGLTSETALKQEFSITFLIHGFNVDRAEGTQQLLGLAALLASEVRGALVATLWPGDSRFGPLAYSFEGKDADDSGESLADFIADLDLPDNVPLAFATHSLGARVAFRCIDHLRSKGVHLPVAEICLMAAAVDNDSVTDPRMFVRAARRARRVVVLSSRRDRVLRLAYPAGDLLQAFFSKDPPRAALGFTGSRAHRRATSPVPNVFDERIPRGLRVRHGDYLPRDEPNDKHRAAALFVTDVLNGRSDPIYSV